MGASSLVEYIREVRRQGYDLSTIRSELLKNGYSVSQVDEALAQVKATSGVPRKVWFILGAIALVAISIGLIITAVVMFGSSVALGVTVTPQSASIAQGDALLFSTVFSSDSDTAVSVSARYEILKDGLIVQSSPDAVTVSQSLSRQKSMSSSQLSPGAYTLRARFSYDGREVVQSFDFTVTQGSNTTSSSFLLPSSLSCVDCNDQNACTQDLCTDGSCTHTPITPCCGNGACEVSEDALSCASDCSPNRQESSASLRSQAITLAGSSKNRAAQACGGISVSADRDDCYIDVTKASDDSSFCELVENTARRDLCYVDHALTGDTSVCSKIVDKRYQASCNQYGRLASLSQQG